jgi:hypothetical protein
MAIFDVGQMPVLQSGYGWRTPYGTLLPPGGRVAAFVRSIGTQDYDDPIIAENLVPTLDAGLKRCRAGRGDIVMVLDGHSESVVAIATVDMLAGLVADTKIIGVGEGSSMPVFRWTAATSAWNVTKANVRIQGLRLRLEGANGVTKAINWTGADGTLADCDVEVASGAAAKATIALEVGIGANKFKLLRNYFRGTSTHNVTDGVKVVAAVEDLLIQGNVMHFSATAANGNIHVTAAALRLAIIQNWLTNDHTLSTACIAIDAVAATGIIADCRMATINNGVAGAQGAVLGAGCLVRGFESYSSDEPVKSGVISPVVVAT